MWHMYGIKNCDTVKKAKNFLTKQKIDFQFHDFKQTAPSKQQLQQWLQQLDWQTLLNKRGLTWRRLPDSKKNNLNKTNAIKLMLENPSIIKRPVLEVKQQIIVGFDETLYRKLGQLT